MIISGAGFAFLTRQDLEERLTLLGIRALIDNRLRLSMAFMGFAGLGSS